MVKGDRSIGFKKGGIEEIRGRREGKKGQTQGEKERKEKE